MTKPGSSGHVARNGNHRGHRYSGTSADDGDKEGGGSPPPRSLVRGRGDYGRRPRLCVLRDTRAGVAVVALPIPHRPVVPRINPESPATPHAERLDDVGFVRRRFHGAAPPWTGADRV